MNDNAFEGLDTLRKEYLQNLLDESLSIQNGMSDNGSLNERLLRDFAHRIHGSGSSYGFDFISHAGKEISTTLNNEIEENNLKQLLNSLIENLKKEKNKFD